MKKPHAMLFVAIIFTGCAGALPQRPVSDFSVLAGAWRGSNNLGNPVDLIVYDDGRFDAIITTPQQTLRRKGQIRREGQQLMYDTDSSYGQVTYYEGDGKRKLIMSGTLKEDGTKFVIEYSPSRP
jgi:hypothetical protein